MEARRSAHLAVRPAAASETFVEIRAGEVGGVWREGSSAIAGSRRAAQNAWVKVVQPGRANRGACHQPNPALERTDNGGATRWFYQHWRRRCRPHSWNVGSLRMSSVVRVLAIGWFVVGLALAVAGAIELVDAPIQKYRRFWLVPLLPAVTIAAAVGAIALARGLWLESSYVAVLGRAMSVPLFAVAVWLLVAGAALLQIGGLNRSSALYICAGTLVLLVTAFNYRVAQRAET